MPFLPSKHCMSMQRRLLARHNNLSGRGCPTAALSRQTTRFVFLSCSSWPSSLWGKKTNKTRIPRILSEDEKGKRKHCQAVCWRVTFFTFFVVFRGHSTYRRKNFCQVWTAILPVKAVSGANSEPLYSTRGGFFLVFSFRKVRHRIKVASSTTRREILQARTFSESLRRRRKKIHRNSTIRPTHSEQ